MCQRSLSYTDNKSKLKTARQTKVSPPQQNPLSTRSSHKSCLKPQDPESPSSPQVSHDPPENESINPQPRPLHSPRTPVSSAPLSRTVNRDRDESADLGRKKASAGCTRPGDTSKGGRFERAVKYRSCDANEAAGSGITNVVVKHEDSSGHAMLLEESRTRELAGTGNGSKGERGLEFRHRFARETR